MVENIDKSEKVFSWSLLGHSYIKSYLQRSIESSNISHAYLFYGPNYLGKANLAELFCMSLICKSKTKKPCYKCIFCKQYKKNTHPDVSIIDIEDDKNSITIHQIRELQQKLSLKSFLTNYKIVIIKNSDSMTEQASNALLKTLEEPFINTVFVLLTENKDKLPKTILSRCQVLNFNLVPTFQIENWLITQGIAKREAKILSHSSNGRPGLVDIYLNKKGYLDNQKNVIKTLLEIIKNKNVNERFLLIDKIIPKKNDDKVKILMFILNQWEYFIRDIILAKNDNINIISNYYFKDSIIRLSQSLKSNNLTTLLLNIYQSKKLLLGSVNPKLIFENLSLSI